ncbi:MAG: sulfatase-like hydrolase/transferase [Lachnospiraceae bacterium]
MTYIFVGLLLITMILMYAKKNWKVIFQSPSYFVFMFLTYASVNYLLSKLLGIYDYESEYRIVCVVSLIVVICISFVGLYLFQVKLNNSKMIQNIKSILLKSSILACVLWLVLYSRGFVFDMNLAFFELCAYAYGMILLLSVLVARFLLEREDEMKRLNSDFQIVNQAVTGALLIVFIMSVGSKSQGIYVNILTVLFVSILIYLFVIIKKKWCLDASLDNNQYKKQYQSNFLRLLPSVLLFSIMVLCENSLEFYCVNINTLPFGIGSFYIDFLRIALAITFGGCGLFSLLKPQYINKITTFIFSIDVAVYIQVMFLNRNLGQTDLEKINWADYKGSMVIGLILWILCVVIFLIINQKNTKTMEQISKAGSLFLIALQMVSIVYMFISIGGWSGDVKKSSESLDISGCYYLTDDHFYDVSKKNVVVFVLDTFSNDYMDIILKNDEHALDAFNDYTYYSNYNGSYDGTPLAMTYMLTGEKFDNEKSCVVSTRDAFASNHAKTFYETLKSNQIDARLYTDSMTQSWLGMQNLKDYYSNVAYDENTAYEVFHDSVIGMMAKSVMYRIMPMVLKPYFLIVTNDFLTTVNSTQSGESKIPSQEDFVNTLEEKGLTLSDDGESFVVYHFEGMHSAASYSEEEIVTCGKENLEIVVRYMEWLKELGVYDDTTIIVTADHGIHETIDGIQSIFMIKEANKNLEHYEVSTAPIDGVDLLPTILQCFDKKIDDYGTTIYDFDENSKRERSVFVRKNNGKLLYNTKTVNTNINATFNCLYQFDYVGDKETLRNRDESKPDEILPLKDFWW